MGAFLLLLVPGRPALLLLAQGQTSAAFTVCRHWLAARRLWPARLAGGGTLGGAVALRRQRAHGVQRSRPALFAGRVGGSGTHRAGGALPAPGAVVGAGACLPGQLSGVDACGPLAWRQLPRLADGEVIVVATPVRARPSRASRAVNPRVRISRIISGSRYEISKSYTVVYTRAFSSLLRGFLRGAVNCYVRFRTHNRGGDWISRNRAYNPVNA
jgi:hypothetical protein